MRSVISTSKYKKINYALLYRWWLTKKYALETFSNFTYIPHGKYNVSRPYRYSELFCEIHQKCFTMNILYYELHAHYSLFQQQIYITTSSVYCFLQMASPKEFIIYQSWPSLFNNFKQSSWIADSNITIRRNHIHTKYSK